MRQILMVAAAVSVLATNAFAQSEPTSGTGTAIISKDVDTVRAQAESQAKQDLVRSLVIQAIGRERLAEVTPDMIARLANQIRPDMIVDRSAQRVGSNYEIKIYARVDPAWFLNKLDDEGVSSSSGQARGDTQPIFVMIDQETGPPRDLEKPAEIVTQYDHSAGSDFRDKSRSSFAESDQAASSYRADRAATYNAAQAGRYDAASAASIHARGSAGYSGDSGSAGASYGVSGAAASSVHAASASSVRAASASSVRNASASSHKVAAASTTDVAASTHDNTHFYQKVVYQTSSTTGPAKSARISLQKALMRYDINVASSDLELSSFFNGKSPTYANLHASTAFQPFVSYLAQKNVAPFFMGGTLTEQDNGHDAATGRASCTGQFVAEAFATNNSSSIANSSPHGVATGVNFEDCQANLSESLAAQAADEMGPQIQKYWLKQMRHQAQTVAAASGSADYTLTIRGASLTMEMQADVMDALAAISGVEKQVFLAQNGNQISFQVRYGGPMPLQMALYQKLRSKPAFAQMKPTIAGQAVTICLSGCGAP